MALFSSMFRRPSHSSELVSLAVRTVGSARAFDRGISKLPSDGNYGYGYHHHRHHIPTNRCYDDDLRRKFDIDIPSLKPLRASTSGPHERLLKPNAAKLSSAQSLLKGVESEIKTLQKNLDEFRAVEGSDEFPFEIINRDFRPEIKREVDDEIIQVSVPRDCISTDHSTTVKDVGASGEDQNDRIPMNVSIYRKSTGMFLQFNLTASPDKISVNGCWIRKLKHSDSSEDPDLCSWTWNGAGDLDNIEKELVEYLQVRGVKPNTFELWKANLKNKDNRECLGIMKDLKGFIEQGIVFTGEKKE